MAYGGDRDGNENIIVLDGRTPQGVRGLKPPINARKGQIQSRTPQGVRGLKLMGRTFLSAFGEVALRKECVD